MKKTIIVLGLLLLRFLTFAQEVKLEVNAPSIVAVGEQFRLTYSLNKRPSSFTPPNIQNFEVLAGPSTSQSTSIEVINGRVTQSENISYTFILEATKEGKFTIDPAKAVVSNEELKSNAINIEVVKQTNSSQQQQQGQNSNQQEQVESRNDLPSSDLFVTIELSRSSVYLGEPLVATLKLYTTINIVGFNDMKFPAFNGFWSQELETPTNIEFKRANVNGKLYSAGVIKKYLLFPQKNSNLEIEPFELEVLYQQRTNHAQSIFDDFFGSVETYKKKLVSKSISVAVKDLPVNAPESFKGGVGSFKLEPSIDKNVAKTNEAITLKLKLSGVGNIKLIESPKVEFPSSFELFDPKTTDKITNSTEGSTGYKLFEYVAIPRTPGDFTIPPIVFTYFDPSKGQYVTTKSSEFNIKVTSDGATTSAVSGFGYGKEDIKFIGKDIRFIKTSKLSEKPFSGYFIGSFMFFFTIIFLLLSFGALMYFMNKHKKEMSDIMLIKNKKANKVARKRLQVAESHLKENRREPFFEEIHKAMWGYLSDKLSIPVSNLTSDNARIELKLKNIEDNDVEEFMRIISVCEYARFAPATDNSEMSLLYNSAHQLISKLEQIIKR
ncbi:MAG: protein BatD [Bacteroidales bacterium]|nr:protein BatD [Bacteroidales bacterium]